ncbi:MAG TPA: EAL domain-containing protein, partial [Piscirickettsiaceae bacterium]|nr:EAL domain-containing protein [Piscirickettsiaceae bacterium]
DQSFIRQLPQTHAQKIIHAIIALAKSLSLKVTAEGIESEKQAQFLTQAGVDTLQGHLFGKAQPIQTFVQTVMEGNT